MCATQVMQASTSEPIAIDSLGKRFYQPELDALRFLAFLLVFCRHVFSAYGLVRKHQAVSSAPMPGEISSATTISHVSYHLNPTWEMIQSLAQSCDFGVCLFFFLSSFLITRLLLIEQNSTGTVAIRDFYIRRTLRIWPLYFFFLGLVTLLSVWAPSIRSTEWRVITSLVFVANWTIVLHGFAGTPIEPLWSISVEEQFYLIWPAFAAFGKKMIVAISSLFMIVPICILIYSGHRPHTINSNIWPNSLVQCLFFSGGALTAIFSKPENRCWNVSKRVSILLGGFACWLFASGVCHVVRTESPGVVSLVAGYFFVLLGTFLIFIAFAGAPSSLFPKATLYLGKISYGLYVFHVLCLSLVMKILFALTAHGSLSTHVAIVIGIAALLGLGITILCATASYHFLEKPFIRLKKRFTLVKSRPA